MKRIRSTAFILLFSFLLMTCYLPPFDEDLSLAMLTAGKLNLETVTGPVVLEGHDEVNDTVYFIPEKGGFIGSGFAVREGIDHLGLAYVDGTISGENYLDMYQSGNELFRDGSNSFDYRLDTVYSGPYIAFFQANNPGNDNFFVWDSTFINVYGPYLLESQMSTDYNTGLNTINEIAGLSLYPNNTMVDRMHIMGLDSTNVLGEGTYIIDNASLTYSSDGNYDVPIYGDMASGGFYYYDPNSTYSFYSVPNGDSYINYSWYLDMAPMPVEMTGFTRRIEAVLTDGNLFCVEGNNGYIHAQDGSELGSFPLGGLKFIHEVWDSAEARYELIFTHTYSTEIQGDHRRNYYYEVYSLPTANLSQLY